MKLQMKAMASSLQLEALTHTETGHDFLGGG